MQRVTGTQICIAIKWKYGFPLGCRNVHYFLEDKTHASM